MAVVPALNIRQGNNYIADDRLGWNFAGSCKI